MGVRLRAGKACLCRAGRGFPALCVLEPEDLTFETLDVHSVIPAYVQPYLENASVESALLMGERQLVALVSDGTREYVLLKNLEEEAEPVILGISARKVSAGSEKIYYINEEGSLCSFDLATNTQSTIAAHVEGFLPEPEQRKAGIFGSGGYGRADFHAGCVQGRGILVDIRADVRGFLLNTEGNKIWIQHAETSKNRETDADDDGAGIRRIESDL